MPDSWLCVGAFLLYAVRSEGNHGKRGTILPKAASVAVSTGSSSVFFEADFQQPASLRDEVEVHGLKVLVINEDVLVRVTAPFFYSSVRILSQVFRERLWRVRIPGLCFKP
jgi:hypothetical protein